MWNKPYRKPRINHSDLIGKGRNKRPVPKELQKVADHFEADDFRRSAGGTGKIIYLVLFSKALECYVSLQYRFPTEENPKEKGFLCIWPFNVDGNHIIKQKRKYNMDFEEVVSFLGEK